MRKLLAILLLLSFGISPALADADPNEECFKTQSAFHDLLIDSSVAMLNMTAVARNLLTDIGLAELAKPTGIIYAIKEYGGAEKAMAVLSAWASKRRDSNYCSGLTEDECYLYTAKDIKSKSGPEAQDGYAAMDLWPKLADDYMVVTGSTAVQYDPNLRRATCRGSTGRTSMPS